MLNQQLNIKIITPQNEDWLFAPKVLTLPSEPAARCRLQGNTPFSYNSGLILISFGWLLKDVGDQRLHFHLSSIFYEGPCLSVRRTKGPQSVVCLCKASTSSGFFTRRQIVSASLPSHLLKYPGCVRDPGERLHAVVYIRRQVAAGEDTEQRGDGEPCSGKHVGREEHIFPLFPFCCCAVNTLSAAAVD